MRVSIIVPARNEARRIVAALAPLQSLRAAGHEVIVVDGGSTDATLALATPLSDRAFAAPSGRATQMNAGANAAAGDVFLFLHADSHLPDEAISTMLEEMARTGRHWGRFDVAIAGDSSTLPLVAAMMNARSRLTGIATGDQGIFVERALFESIGGYPDQPLMEDVEISRRLKRAAGAPLCLSPRLVTSGRRWERDGPWRTIVNMWGIRLAYWRGADPARLAARYRSATSPPAVTLQVFARNPVAGQVKTRLAAAIGDDEAAAIYARMVERTLDTAAAARIAGIIDRIELWASPDTDAPAFAEWRDNYRVELRRQCGVDLGARMRHALHSALARGSHAILIGTDCPLLDVSYLACASAALDDHPAVFGPAEDGGYVLVGLARAIDAFSGIPWSTADTMALTRAKLAAQRVRWQELPTLWDVDSAADLERSQKLPTAIAASENGAVG